MLVNMNSILKDAQKNKYGVGLFNVIDTDGLQAAIAAAEELRSPIIIGTAEVLLPYGDLHIIGPGMIEMAKRANVPVAVHYDHGLTYERCVEALRLGFSSVMFDGSANGHQENLEGTRDVVKIAHEFGASVEGEIGHVGNTDVGDEQNEDLYTKPEDAVDFIEKTGVDALAISIGTAHGPYTKTPKLDFERLTQIRYATDAPLVLHGGSGLSDDDFRKAIAGGITKVNIFTDLCSAGLFESMKEYPYKDGYLILHDAKVKAMKEEAKKKLTLFGSAGKAI